MSVLNLRSLAIAGALSAVLVPTSFAAGAYHSTTSEIGATYHPDHINQATRAQVASDLDKAQKNPRWSSTYSRGAPWPAAGSGEPKTRAQVNAELQAAMKHPAWNSVSRGAPWPPVLTTGK
ncbi:DUF4148 domain-containing protein [Variovorax sp. PAMC 28711]|uniref:DUF4148 domain-containing protein n=1 Tax=Variovorax sp. PAMC 28711 TaxID=1795631 RepID=UPI0012E74D89|nr:DUF4148 domain-containing protein [Variovorax sp. PAMC 28711]